MPMVTCFSYSRHYYMTALNNIKTCMSDAVRNLGDDTINLILEVMFSINSVLIKSRDVLFIRSYS